MEFWYLSDNCLNHENYENNNHVYHYKTKDEALKEFYFHMYVYVNEFDLEKDQFILRISDNYYSFEYNDEFLDIQLSLVKTVL